jgi:hypothetical protein
MASSFCQIPLEDSSKPKTAFVTYNGLYQFRTLPFGLTNAAMSFQMVRGSGKNSGLVTLLTWRKYIVKRKVPHFFLTRTTGLLHSEFDGSISSKPKTAFVTYNGLYQFRTLPFGLTNAAMSFQMVMSKALQGLTWKHVLCYIDDILVL